MTPEEDVIDPSSLTKFRKLRLKDVNLLDLLIHKTVEIALEKDIIKSRSIIVDATHTRARYNLLKPIDILRDRGNKLRKAIYQIDESMKEKLPFKTQTDDLEDEIEYTGKLIKAIENESTLSNYPNIKEQLNVLKETVEDEDAKVGHKSVDTSFFGYKSHLAISEERIITAAVITTGEKSDGHIHGKS